MAYSIFISSVHEDAHLISNIKNWAMQGLLGNGVIITHETEDNRPQGDEVIRQLLGKKIEGASAVLILVGRDTHNHNWVKTEIELANSFNKKLIAARIPGTTGGAPQILTNKPIIPFDPNSIKKAIAI